MLEHNTVRSPGVPATSRLRLLVRRNTSILAALAPVILVGVVFAYPVFEILRLSFTELPSAGDHAFTNYTSYFEDPVQRRILLRTFTTASISTVLALAIGYPYAYLMTIVKSRWRLVMLGFVLLPFWTSIIVRLYAWIVLLQDSGPVPDLIDGLGLGRPRILGTTTAVTIGMTQVLLPFMVLPLYSALTAIDRNLLLAAESLGARPSVAFARVYIPLSLPGIIAGGSLVFIISLGFYLTPALLGSPQNSLISQQIVIQVSTLLSFGGGGAMALILLVLTLALLALASVAARRWTRALGVTRQGSRT